MSDPSDLRQWLPHDDMTHAKQTDIAQRSEQQKWTREYVQNITGAPIAFCKTIADAHNAALAAEHAKLKKALRDWVHELDRATTFEKQLAAERQRASDATGAYGAEIKSHQRTNDLLTIERKRLVEIDEVLFDPKPRGYEPNRVEAVRQLIANVTAERQRREQAEQGHAHYRELFEEIRQAVREITPTDATKKEIIDCVKSLVSQLLSAQAAIKRHNETDRAFDCYKIHSDLDALRLHDAEVRKAYIEKLTAILGDRSKGEVETWGFVAMFIDMMKEADNALAKAKEDK